MGRKIGRRPQTQLCGDALVFAHGKFPIQRTEGGMKHSSRFPLLSLTAALLLALTAGGSWGEEDGVLGAWVLAEDADGTDTISKSAIP